MGFSDTSLQHAAHLLTQGLLIALFVVFALANFHHWKSTGRPSGLSTTILEGWAAYLFLIRRPPRTVSVQSLAWIAAPVSSFAMLLAQPQGGRLTPAAAETLQLTGLLLALASLRMLSRSFGLVAAN